jgi:hypothetical protein
MAINVDALFAMSVNDFLEDDLISAKSSIVIDGCNTSIALSATTTPAATMVAHDQLTLSGGADSVDLTAAPSTNGVTVDATGLRGQIIIISAPTANVGAVLWRCSHANGIDNFGTDATATIGAGQALMISSGDGGTNIANGTFDIMEFVGTASDLVNWIVVFG